jgi:hypothetical protein
MAATFAVARRRTGTIPAHILTDASGLRSVRRVWLGVDG